MKKIILCLCMLIGLWGCQSKIVTKDENVKVVVASDLHYFFKDYYKDCEWFEESMLYGDGKMVTYGDEIIDAFIQRMIEIKPHLVILTGDIAFNGEIGSHQELAKKLMKLKEHQIEVAVIPGNHDVDNIFVKGYGKDDYFDVESVDASQFRDIYKELGYQNPQHLDSLSYRLDLNDKYTFLMMDSTAHELTGSALDTGGYFTDSTKQWLEKQLIDMNKKNKIPLIAMHHNLVNHNELLGARYTIKDYQEIADLFKKYNVPFVLSGHIHCQNIKEINGIYDIVTSSLLNAPLQYGVIDLSANQMKYKNQSLTISKDSLEYFDLVSSTHFAEDFEGIKDLKVRELMKDVIVKANRYYFTGCIAKHKEEIMNMEGYLYYEQEEGKSLSFYKEYLDSMLSDEGVHQELSIDIK